jgi:steroid delta-isomerase-like uncharacterized protein
MEKQQLLDVARGSMKAFNDRDWDRFNELLTPDSVYDEVGTHRKLTGRKEVIGALQGWTDAFPDLKGRIESSTAADDRAILEVTYEGTHDGSLPTPTGAIAPTHKHVATRCLQVFRVADGHITETKNYFDMLSMLQALDALPTGSSA